MKELGQKQLKDLFSEINYLVLLQMLTVIVIKSVS